MTTEQKNIMIRAYIETESRKLNIKYPNLLSDEKIEHLIEMYDDSDKDYDEIIEEIDAIFNQFIDEYMELMNKIKNLEERGVSEEEIKRITEVSVNNIKFKEEFGLHAFFDDIYDEVFEIRSLDVVDSNVSNINAEYPLGVNRNRFNYEQTTYDEKHYGQSYNYQMIELFKLIDNIEAYGDGLDDAEKIAIFNEKKEELLNSFGFVATGIAELDYNTVKNLHNNFSNDVDLVVDEGTTKMSYVVDGDVDLFIDGVINEEAFRLNEAEILYNYARDNGKELKLHTLLWHNAYPKSLEVLLDGKSDSEKRDITMNFLNQYMGYLSRWANENDYQFKQIDVVNEIANDSENTIGVYRDSFWTEAVGIKPLPKRDENMSDLEYSKLVSPEELKRHTDECSSFYNEVFMMARGHFPNSQLLYNEYNEFLPYKAERMCLIVDSIEKKGKEALNERAIMIDGIGMQSHFYDYYKDSNGNVRQVTANDIDTSMGKLSQLGIGLHRSEMDFTYHDVNAKEEILNAIDMVDEKYDVKSCVAWNNNDTTSWKSNSHVNNDIHMVDQFGNGKEQYNRVVDRYSKSKALGFENQNIKEEVKETTIEKDKPKVLVKKSNNDNTNVNAGFISTLTLIITTIILLGMFIIICI